MKTIRNLSLCLFAVAAMAYAQAVTTSTTLAQAQGTRDTTIVLTSNTNVVARGVNNQVMTGLYIDREYEIVTSNASSSGTSSTWNVIRGQGTGASGTIQGPHLSGATVWLGSPAIFDLGPYDRVGSCASATFVSLPLIEVRSGTLITCDANTKYRPLGVGAFFVPPSACVGVPTTLTQTTTYPNIGTIPIPTVKMISNGAAGTLAVTCTFAIPTYVSALRGSMIQDVTMFLASSATGSGVVPTSMGTPTLGTLTFPAAGLVQTASSNTAAAIGGTGTLTGGGVTGVSGFMTAVTTDGTFYTLKTTFATAVDLSTDLRILQFVQPVLQSAGSSVITLFSPGLLVHYYAPLPY